MSVFSTTPELLEVLASVFGGKTYDCTRKANKKPIACWVANGVRAAQVCEEIWPYLREPSKRERARIAAQELAPHLGHPTLSKAEAAVKRAVELKLLAA